MLKNGKILMAGYLVAALGLSGCATPHVVAVNQQNDSSLSCSGLNQQFTQAHQYYKKAEADRKVTGTNIAAAVLFAPALLGTYENTKDAKHAAKKREKKLIMLGKAKDCQWSRVMMTD